MRETPPTRKRRKQLLNHLNYEVQVLTGYGWGSAGNWPARTLKEAMTSLDQCANGAAGKGDVHDYRLVRLTPTVLAVRKATLTWNEREHRYDPLTSKGNS